MYRAALLWTSEGSGPIINGRHHAFAEKLVSDTPKEECNGPGVYIQHSPEVRELALTHSGICCKINLTARRLH